MRVALLVAFIGEGKLPVLQFQPQPGVFQRVGLLGLMGKSGGLPFLERESTVAAGGERRRLQQNLALAIPGGGGAVGQLLHDGRHVLRRLTQQLPAARVSGVVDNAEIGVRRVERQRYLRVTHVRQRVEQNDFFTALAGADAFRQHFHVQIEQLPGALQPVGEPRFDHAVDAIGIAAADAVVGVGFHRQQRFQRLADELLKARVQEFNVDARGENAAMDAHVFRAE